MEALLVIDMQQGMLQDGNSPNDLEQVVGRINEIARRFRKAQKPVVFVQHCGAPGESCVRGESGWHFLPALERDDSDLVVFKTTCDSFCQTELDSLLRERSVKDLVITGWATDFCVDTTIRAAASLGYNITVSADAHTVADRPHLDAVSIIRHHHAIWRELIVPDGWIRILSTDEILAAETNATI